MKNISNIICYNCVKRNLPNSYGNTFNFRVEFLRKAKVLKMSSLNTHRDKYCKFCNIRLDKIRKPNGRHMKSVNFQMRKVINSYVSHLSWYYPMPSS